MNQHYAFRVGSQPTSSILEVHWPHQEHHPPMAYIGRGEPASKKYLADVGTDACSRHVFNTELKNRSRGKRPVQQNSRQECRKPARFLRRVCLPGRRAGKRGSHLFASPSLRSKRARLRLCRLRRDEDAFGLLPRQERGSDRRPLLVRLCASNRLGHQFPTHRR